MSVITSILDTMRDLILDDPAFDGLLAIYRGVPNTVPVTLYPFGILVIVDEDEAQPLTGGNAIRAYSGTIAINVKGRDVPTPVDRRANVESYDSVTAYASELVRLFNEHPTLDDLTGAEWSVAGLYIAEGEIVYGYAEPDDRVNNYENYCIVPFVCAVSQ